MPSCHDVALVEGVLGRVAQGDELIAPVDVGDGEVRGPGCRAMSSVARPPQLVCERVQLAGIRGAMKAADAHVDRMDLTPAETS